MGVRIARVLITAELLRQALALPDDAVLMDARPADRMGDFELKFHSASLPEIAEGAVIPLTSPTITAQDMDCGHTEKTWRWE